MIRSTTVIAICVGIFATAAWAVDPAPNGIEIPQGYKDWRVIAVSHRSDNNTMRVIIGNDAAIAAARSGKVNPWPDGAILGKVVWSNRANENWSPATEPNEFKAAEFMYKDSKRFAKTGGWGYARWLGAAQKPYGDDSDFDQECFTCHTPVKARDYVFTTPIKLP